MLVRHWDTWIDESIKQVQVVFLERSGPRKPDKTEPNQTEPTSPSMESLHSLSSEDDEPRQGSSNDVSPRWAFASKILAPMQSTTLECPVGPFGGSSDFDISASHLIFTAKDPNLNRAWHTRQPLGLFALIFRSSADSTSAGYISSRLTRTPSMIERPKN